MARPSGSFEIIVCVSGKLHTDFCDYIGPAALQFTDISRAGLTIYTCKCVSNRLLPFVRHNQVRTFVMATIKHIFFHKFYSQELVINNYSLLDCRYYFTWGKVIKNVKSMEPCTRVKLRKLTRDNISSAGYFTRDCEP